MAFLDCAFYSFFHLLFRLHRFSFRAVLLIRGIRALPNVAVCRVTLSLMLLSARTRFGRWILSDSSSWFFACDQCAALFSGHLLFLRRLVTFFRLMVRVIGQTARAWTRCSLLFCRCLSGAPQLLSRCWRLIVQWSLRISGFPAGGRAAGCFRRYIETLLSDLVCLAPFVLIRSLW